MADLHQDRNRILFLEGALLLNQNRFSFALKN